jgi:hypothetical protein
MFFPTFNKINEMITDHCLTIGEQIVKFRSELLSAGRVIKTQHLMIQQLQQQVNQLMDLKSRRESNEPWIDFVGGDIDPKNGLQINLDWNDAFIDQLRIQGYRGTTETELVSQYLKQVGSLVGGKNPELPTTETDEI